MKTLIIDTSSSYLFVSFYEEDKNSVIFYKSMLSHNNHSENLLTVIEEGLKQNKLSLFDFNKVIVGMGPGSYTGLRVGMVVGKMISFTCKIDLYIISSLTLVASKNLANDGLYLVHNVAKKDYCYMKLIDVKNGIIKNIIEDKFVNETKFTEILNEYNPKVIKENDYKLCESIIVKNAKKVVDIHNVVPNYLRKANS